MRIAMLIWSYWPGHEGGAERQCRKVVEQVTGKVIDFIILTSWFSVHALPQETVEGGQVVRLGALAPFETMLQRNLIRVLNTFFNNRDARNQSDFRIRAILFWLMLPVVWCSRLLFILALFRWFASNSGEVDVIHVHETSWLAGVAAWIGERYRLPVLAKTATVPALPKIGYDVPLRGLWHNLRKKCYFIAQYEGLVNDLIAQGITQERIFTLPNGVIIPEKSAQPKQLGAVIYVGNFTQGAHWKAFDILIQAWSKVHRKIPAARLDMLGGGNISQWNNLLESLGCEKSVRFVGTVTDLSLYYEKSCLFVLPSRVEGISNALLEAQSYGLPCVVSNIPGNLAVVQDGVNGIVVPVGDADALANAIIRLIDDPELRIKLGRAARRTVSENFSLVSVTERLVQIYRLIASPRGED